MLPINFNQINNTQNYLNPTPQPVVRSYPPVGPSDTCIYNPENKTLESIHGKAIVFRDEEILHTHTVSSKKALNPESTIFAHITLDGKAVIQQQATRGCTAAVAAMLIVDLGGEPDLFRLRHTNLGNDESMLDQLKKAGVQPIVNTPQNLIELQDFIDQHGSAIVSICDSEIGDHVIVVDRIADQGVELRDPYHGWKINISQETFLSRVKLPYRIIQAKKID